MHHVMTALGYTVTSCTERREPVLAENPVHCLMLDRELAPGTCIGTRTIVEVETAEGIPGVAHMEVRPLSQPGEVEAIMGAVEGAPAGRRKIEIKACRPPTGSQIKRKSVRER